MSQYDIYDIYDMATSFMRPSAENHVTPVIVHEGVIPIVFVPGVMGSNLVNTQSDDTWRLDSQLSASPWLIKGAQARKRILNPTQTVVDSEGDVSQDIARRYIDHRSGDTIPTDELLRERGWGEVANMSYGNFLAWLENQLNIEANSAFSTLESNLTRHYIGTRGLSEEQAQARAKRNAQTLGRFNFPVHACGYNWLQSNSDSAAALAQRVDEIIAGYHKARMRCKQAILITHSMGGLVARYYSEVSGGNANLLGIVHGVMPTTGAAVFYRRMKSGTESQAFSPSSWATSQVLGASSREMTAVLAQAPGPLQLVPTPEYGSGWLRIEKQGESALTLPTANDPYTDIYLEREHWWGMMDEALAMPELGLGAPDRQRELHEAWESYAKLVSHDVAKFHADTQGKFHTNTYLFYSDSDAHPSYGTVTWRGGEVSYGSDTLMSARMMNQYGERRMIAEHDSRGRPRFCQYTISDADEPGDGTVPVRSGSRGVSQARESLAIATEHEPAYNQEAARWFTLASLLEIAEQWE
ncbi:esterase/lipase family protein [Modicisalibacter radicis]|uniref:esterase/lipase family protein n=1 Tax=Halomonas sp. EAR18 TaxID=2518972 RepID=UPI00109D6B99|nr:hypothetical protein [Halomonas sp. EAR18]